MAVIGEEGIPLREMGYIGEWIVEAEEKAGSEGEARGERKMLLLLLRDRFDELPESVVERVNSATREWCENLAGRVYRVASLEELGL